MLFQSGKQQVFRNGSPGRIGPIFMAFSAVMLPNCLRTSSASFVFNALGETATPYGEVVPVYLFQRRNPLAVATRDAN
jgi:hypothetical protein